MTTKAPSRAKTAADFQAALLARLRDWNGLLERHPDQARQTVLKPLLEDRIVLTPRVTSGGRFYDFAGKAGYGTSNLPAQGVVTASNCATQGRESPLHHPA